MMVDYIQQLHDFAPEGMAQRSYRASEHIYNQAKELIPGGFHLSGRPLLQPNNSPLYFERGNGSHIWDADKNEYIDFVMAFGPFLLGYCNTEVNDAAISQINKGSLLSLNHTLHIKFMEVLLSRFEGADMGIFFKTGSEATTAAVRIARRATGRVKIARCGYHGWHDWCIPNEPYVTNGLMDQIYSFDAQNPMTLTALLSSSPGQFAAVILAPEMIYPRNSTTIHEIARVARAHGALFILDEIKTAFRAPCGSMQAFYKVIPDMTTVSKALGNGWAVAAVIGTRPVMGHAAGMHLSATFHGDTAPMAAAIATLNIIERDGVRDFVDTLGQRLIDGLNAAARDSNFPVVAYGEPIPAMPFMKVLQTEEDNTTVLRSLFYETIIQNGILLHPRHMWFISSAHTASEIDKAIEVVHSVMRKLRTCRPDLVS